VAEFVIDDLIVLAGRVSHLLQINSFGWVFYIFYIAADWGACQ
jgi:hypothetical protein